MTNTLSMKTRLGLLLAALLLALLVTTSLGAGSAQALPYCRGNGAVPPGPCQPWIDYP